MKIGKCKKSFAVMLAVLMVVGSLSACSKTDTGEEPSASVEADATDSAGIDTSEHTEYTLWLYADDYEYYTSYSENPVVTYLNKKFNMTLTFQQPPVGSETEGMSTMLGTGDYTDAFEITYCSSNVEQLYKDEVIIDLAPYLDEYMPNYKALLEEREDIAKALYDDEGHLFTLTNVDIPEALAWGGLIYRHDILETMTEQNVVFPSGEDQPTTIEDWEYMLGLFKTYFEAAEMGEYAGLILPSKGYWGTGELVSGFGVGGSYYREGDTVKYGPMEEGFYNYLVKMKEWYEKGYIYSDFASRTNDVFYMPNTALTYGGAAGSWFGMSAQLGDAMSMPEYGLDMDVRAAYTPLDTEHGITSADNRLYSGVNNRNNSWVITNKCKNVERLLMAFDHLYDAEGSRVRSHGLDVEHGAADDVIYQSVGKEAGRYTVEEDGTLTFDENETLWGSEGSNINGTSLVGQRLPGIQDREYTWVTAAKEEIEADKIWSHYGQDGWYPDAATQTLEEGKTFSSVQPGIEDYINAIVPKFIMGSEELSEATFATYVEQLKALGIEGQIEIQQAAYDRYLSR